MKKNKFSLIVLLFEILAIVAMHTFKNNSSQIADKAPVNQSSPIFSASNNQSNNSTYLILPGYPF